MLTAADLAELLQAARTSTTHVAARDPLASLHLDCAREPAACADISASTNAYEGSKAGAADAAAAAAEAAAFLTAASTGMAHASWDAVIGSHHQQDAASSQHGREQLLHLTNSYEGVEVASWQHRCQAEEAGAHYLDVSTLDLDCSPAAVSRDPHARMECRRSRAVNKYEEGGPLSSQQPDPAATAAAAGAVDAAVAAAALAAASADTGVELGRSYYKTACNSPAVHELYKSPHGQQQRESSRKHYKNPANAPTPLEVLLPQRPQGGKVSSW